MNDERWLDTKAMVTEKFDVTSERVEDLDEEDGPGTVEIIEFVGPLGNMRLTRATKPLILDKKVLSSRRIGGESAVQYKYSDTEKTHKFTAYRLDEGTGEWTEMPLERGGTSVF